MGAILQSESLADQRNIEAYANDEALILLALFKHL